MNEIASFSKNKKLCFPCKVDNFEIAHCDTVRDLGMIFDSRLFRIPKTSYNSF